MEKRMILAIALSLLVVLTFQFLGPKKQATIDQGATRAHETPAVQPGKMPEKPAQALPTSTQVPIKEEVTRIDTRKYALEFSSAGGSLKRLILKEYLDKKQEEIIIDATQPQGAPFALTTDRFPGLETAQFRATKINGALEYTFQEKDWVEITKRYTFPQDEHYIGLEVAVKNISGKRMPFSYLITGPADISKSSEMTGRSFVEADTLVDSKVWKAKGVKGKEERSGEVFWTGIKNRYFAVILKPKEPAQTAVLAESGSGDLSVALGSGSLSLAPGEVITNTYLFYAGPLDETLITGVDDSLGQIVDYGFFGGVSKALLKVLRFFHGIVKNWGVAIILLTVLINLILFPLTKKSFASMQQMKKLQPHMQKLKELHKDNPQKLNKEMMELYKKYNVNPLGGCLPLILQMPIFIALYQGLVRSIELKSASFLWIKDLSRPDAVPLPFTLPVLGASINILPLFMVGMMVVQQKISQGATAASMTDDQASQQKMMMVMFPLLFGFLFYKMPSGLVLYWLTNTILMTVEQGFISRQLDRS